MIEEIWIRNLGVIDDATLPLGPGFTVLSGETGAGKTMVVTALGLLLGDRADSGDIRSGTSQASVEGRWLITGAGPIAARVAEAGGQLERPTGPVARPGEAELILARQLTNEGRSRATVGGRSAPLGVLGEIGEQLVTLHGQSDQLRLRSLPAQRETLDTYAGAELAAVLGDYRAVHSRWHEGQQELDTLVAEQEKRQREAEELRLSIEQIERLAPKPGEDAEVDARIERLTNLEDLRLAAAAAHEALAGEEPTSLGSATALLDGAKRQLERVVSKDAQLEPIAEQLASASYLVAEVAGLVAAYLTGLDAGGAAELEILQERKSDLGALARRYGSLEEALAVLDSGSARLLELDNDGTRIEELAAEVQAAGAQVAQLAARLTVLRTQAGERLGEAVTAELAALAMPTARLAVRVSTAEEFSATGRDQVEFLLQPHPGAEPRPVAKGASGGELSRVMLALEVVIAATDPVPTFIFDEVDAGVGGAAAIEIGRRLARLAEHSQVIVVTHLAQVAAFATNHLSVVKNSDGRVTRSSVRQLQGHERVAEMARLLSGLSDSQSGLAHASELLQLAAQDRARQAS